MGGIDMIYTKEEFKSLWELNEDGGGITWDDIADCSVAWGITKMPRCISPFRLLKLVCTACGVKMEE